MVNGDRSNATPSRREDLSQDFHPGPEELISEAEDGVFDGEDIVVGGR